MSFAAPLVQEMLQRRRPGHSLEAPFYLSPDILRADVDLIFSRHWIFVGVSPQVPEAGDYVTVDIGTNSVVIVRDDDMQIRAFHNVCRHRGSRLCASQRGSVGNIVCPYHQWTYDLSGKLINADHMGDAFDRNQHGLKPVHLRNLEGLLFVCLAEQPPADFDEAMRVIAPYIAPHRLDDCKVAQQIDIVEHGNWKLTMENNRECYHCMVCHPELTVAMFEQGFGYAPGPQSADGLARFERIVADSHARWEAMGLPSREIDRLNDTATGYRVMRLPLDRAGESYTMDSHVACKRLLGDFKDPKLGGLSVWTQPNSWHHFLSDHVVSFAALPVDAEHTLVRTTWCVHKDAAEGRDYDVDNLTRVWRATNEQDGRLVEEVQRGAATGAYEPGPYSPYTEGLVEKFVDWYVGRLRAELK
jgi:Rieske 2Fe-2S family protein